MGGVAACHESCVDFDAIAVAEQLVSRGGLSFLWKNQEMSAAGALCVSLRGTSPVITW